MDENYNKVYRDIYDNLKEMTKEYAKEVEEFKNKEGTLITICFMGDVYKLFKESKDASIIKDFKNKKDVYKYLDI